MLPIAVSCGPGLGTLRGYTFMYAVLMPHLDRSVSGSTSWDVWPTAMLVDAEAPPARAVTVANPVTEPASAAGAVNTPCVSTAPSPAGSTVQVTAAGGSVTGWPD